MITINFDSIKNLINFIAEKLVPDPPAPPIPARPPQSQEVAAEVEQAPVFQTEIRTFEQAVDFVATTLDPTAVEDPFFHMRHGMSIRNGLGLWHKTSPLHQHMLQRFGLCHADDTGMIITNAANAKINRTEYDPAVDVEFCKEHWRRHGYDPATMERVSTSTPVHNFQINVAEDGIRFVDDGEISGL